LAQRRLLYKIRPKTHYFLHMIDHHELTKLCLMFLSTFGDEDYMGKIRRICQGCHGMNYMLSWARKYILKRALQWREMKKWNHICLGQLHVGRKPRFRVNAFFPKKFWKKAQESHWAQFFPNRFSTWVMSCGTLYVFNKEIARRFCSGSFFLYRVRNVSCLSNSFWVKWYIYIFI
jgi:hypothetical protein